MFFPGQSAYIAVAHGAIAIENQHRKRNRNRNAIETYPSNLTAVSVHRWMRVGLGIRNMRMTRWFLSHPRFLFADALKRCKHVAGILSSALSMAGCAVIEVLVVGYRNLLDFPVPSPRPSFSHT
jgi:hypothetical protein